MNKRYMVFAWDEWESKGGMKDYCFSFNTLEEFKNNEDKTHWLDIIQVYDTKNHHWFDVKEFEKMCRILENYL